MTPRRQPERGTVAVMVALLMVVLVTFAAFAVDITNQVRVAHEAQNAADASALAAVLQLNGSSTGITNAYTAASLQLNKANGKLVDNAAGVRFGVWNLAARTWTRAPVYLPYLTAAVIPTINAVQVDTPTLSVPTYFAMVIGTTNTSVQRHAVAVGLQGPSNACGFPFSLCLSKVPKIPDACGTVFHMMTRVGSHKTDGTGGLACFSGGSCGNSEFDGELQNILGGTCMYSSITSPLLQGGNDVNPNNKDNLVAIALHVPTIVIYMPVLADADCDNKSATPIGYLGATLSTSQPKPNGQIDVIIDCDHSPNSSTGGVYFGGKGAFGLVQ